MLWLKGNMNNSIWWWAFAHIYLLLQFEHLSNTILNSWKITNLWKRNHILLRILEMRNLFKRMRISQKVDMKLICEFIHIIFQQLVDSKFFKWITLSFGMNDFPCNWFLIRFRIVNEILHMLKSCLASIKTERVFVFLIPISLASFLRIFHFDSRKNVIFIQINNYNKGKVIQKAILWTKSIKSCCIWFYLIWNLIFNFE